MFRVANVRNSQLLESHFKAILLGNIVTREGKTFRYVHTQETQWNVTKVLSVRPASHWNINRVCLGFLTVEQNNSL